MGYADGSVYSLTKVPLCIFFSIYSWRNLVWLNFGTILKMALFYSLRNGQVNGESHKGASLCIMPFLPLFNHLNFDMAILVGHLCHLFLVSFPKSCVQVILCAIVKKKNLLFRLVLV